MASRGGGPLRLGVRLLADRRRCRWATPACPRRPATSRSAPTASASRSTTQSGFCTRHCDRHDCPDGFSLRGSRPLRQRLPQADRLQGRRRLPLRPHLRRGHRHLLHQGRPRRSARPARTSAQCPTGGACFHADRLRRAVLHRPLRRRRRLPGRASRARRSPRARTAPLRSSACPPTRPATTARPLCSACKGDDECGGPFDLCVRNVVSGETFCGRDCNPEKNVCPMVGCDPDHARLRPEPRLPHRLLLHQHRQDRPTPPSRGPYQCVPNSNTCVGYCDATDDVGPALAVRPGPDLRPATPASRPPTAASARPAPTTTTAAAAGSPRTAASSTTAPTARSRARRSAPPRAPTTRPACTSFGAGFVCKPVHGPDRRRCSSYCMPAARAPASRAWAGWATTARRTARSDCVTGVCLAAG